MSTNWIDWTWFWKTMFQNQAAIFFTKKNEEGWNILLWAAWAKNEVIKRENSNSDQQVQWPFKYNETADVSACDIMDEWTGRHRKDLAWQERQFSNWKSVMIKNKQRVWRREYRWWMTEFCRHGDSSFHDDSLTCIRLPVFRCPKSSLRREP